MGFELNLDFSQAIKIPVHEVQNAPYGGLGRVACDVTRYLGDNTIGYNIPG